MKRLSLEALTEILLAKAEALGDARAHVEQLADQYPVLKEMAIIRVMARDGISSNAAKDIVKTDPEFMEHRTRQRKAGIALCLAEAEHEVAKILATHASLITPAILEMQAAVDAANAELEEASVMIRDLTKAKSDLESELERLEEENDGLTVSRDSAVHSLRAANETVHVMANDLRKTRQYLSHRINDVQNMTETIERQRLENEKLREGILHKATDTTPVGQYESLEPSRKWLAEGMGVV